jgi:hypothetical protein
MKIAQEQLVDIPQKGDSFPAARHFWVCRAETGFFLGYSQKPLTRRFSPETIQFRHKQLYLNTTRGIL